MSFEWSLKSEENEDLAVSDDVVTMMISSFNLLNFTGFTHQGIKRIRFKKNKTTT